MVYFPQATQEEKTVQELKKHAQSIVKELIHSKKQINNIPREKKAQKTNVLYSAEEREEITDSFVLDRIRHALTRDKSNWTYLSEQPIRRKIGKERIIDNRSLSVKKKYIEYRKIEDMDKIDEICNGERMCAICLQKYKKKNICGVLKCTHVFHMRCINSHIAIIGNCPICRKDIISGVVHH